MPSTSGPWEMSQRSYSPDLDEIFYMSPWTEEEEGISTFFDDDDYRPESEPESESESDSDSESDPEDEDEDEDDFHGLFAGTGFIFSSPEEDIPPENIQDHELRLVRARTAIASLFQNLSNSGILSLLESEGILLSEHNHRTAFNTLRQLRDRELQLRALGPSRYPIAPSEAGRALMASGYFGINPSFLERLKNRRRCLGSRLMWRELATTNFGYQNPQAIVQGQIPNATPDTIIHYDRPCYSGQFSDDGNFYFSCAQDLKVRLYDTSNPHDWKHYKTIDHPTGRWTITDCTLSSDNRFLAYSSIDRNIYLVSTNPASTLSPTVLDVGHALRSPDAFSSRTRPGVWSVRFSGDGRELVSGVSGGSVIVQDLETCQSVFQVKSHLHDVNAVCFADKLSPNILFSGSDDTTIRIWDRRSMADGRGVGVFVGHREGLTFVESKDDGRYVLSNSKDQTMKLWDLRKMMTTSHFDGVNIARCAQEFDYRYCRYPKEDYYPHPDDCSVVTFHGHSVLKTLIRCHFSPPGSTDSKYVYTGSSDGKVYIYNIDGTLAVILDINKETFGTKPRLFSTSTSYSRRESARSLWKTVVRDASWHPHAAMITASAWNEWKMEGGTCSIHTWDGGHPLGGIREPNKIKNYNAEMGPLPQYDAYTEMSGWLT
ncbi:hypothetical protein FQN57_006482 [Myotisia sp. PD_48]|nr:hypothetical protein FQN57_006482 [Myotisia sp. PD_48]